MSEGDDGSNNRKEISQCRFKNRNKLLCDGERRKKAQKLKLKSFMGLKMLFLVLGDVH